MLALDTAIQEAHKILAVESRNAKEVKEDLYEGASQRLTKEKMN